MVVVVVLVVVVVVRTCIVTSFFSSESVPSKPKKYSNDFAVVAFITNVNAAIPYNKGERLQKQKIIKMFLLYTKKSKKKCRPNLQRKRIAWMCQPSID